MEPCGEGRAVFASTVYGNDNSYLSKFYLVLIVESLYNLQ